MRARALAEKFPGGGRPTEKDRKTAKKRLKNSKKYRKIAQLSLFQGANGKKTKNSKKYR